MISKCPVEYTLSMMSGKWTAHILMELACGPIRSGTLEKRIISIMPKVLIQRLRKLEESGLVVRTIYPKTPSHVNYSLSEKGKSLFIVIYELKLWGISNSTFENEDCQRCRKCLSIQ